MMISPEVYYKECLEGKNLESIYEQINSLREEIAGIRRELETEEGMPRATIMPSPRTRVNSLRDYLEMAKMALEEAGGKYEATNEELQDQEFNASLMYMKTFVLEIGTFFSGSAKYIYTISGETVLFDVDHSFYLKPSNLSVYEPFTREEFIRGIADLHIGEWKRQYDNSCVLDGTQWNIRIEYEDDREPVQIYGSNAYPYNFEDLLWFLDLDYEDDLQDEDSETAY